MATKQKTTIYFDEHDFDEIQAEAKRLDRSVAWVLRQAWQHAKQALAEQPTMCDAAQADEVNRG